MAVELYLHRTSTFNGTVLPNYPNDEHYDPQTYPYSLIVLDSGEYELWQSSEPFYRHKDYSFITIDKTAKLQCYKANKSMCKWELYSFGISEGDSTWAYLDGSFVWANHVIYVRNSTTEIGYSCDPLWLPYDAEKPTITSLSGGGFVLEDGTIENPTTYNAGDEAQPLVCTASVSDGGTLLYEWYRNGILVGRGSNYTPSTQFGGDYVYYCVVTNTLTGESGFSDIDVVYSDSMLVVVNAAESPTENKASKYKHLIGYVLKQCGVPMAELIAEMLCKTNKPNSIIAYSYNGMQLPALPECAFPYALIRVRYNADLSLNNVRLYYYDSNAYYSVTDSGVLYFGYTKAVIYNLSGDVWVLQNEPDNSQFRVPDQGGYTSWGVTTYLLWANFKVEYDGTVYMEKSDPIPIYDKE